MIYALLALACLVGAMGLFAWLIIERTKYYETGDQKRKFVIMCITMGCIALLLLAIGLYAADDAAAAAAAAR